MQNNRVYKANHWLTCLGRSILRKSSNLKKKLDNLQCNCKSACSVCLHDLIPCKWHLFFTTKSDPINKELRIYNNIKIYRKTSHGNIPCWFGTPPILYGVVNNSRWWHESTAYVRNSEVGIAFCIIKDSN
jgi:hypothetical protein